MTRRVLLTLPLALACAGGTPPPPVAPAPAAETTPVDHPGPTAPRDPLLPPAFALLAGLMPLRSIGAEEFRLAHPAADGRGVVIGILDSGVDAGLPGLRTTTTGEDKLLDLRDFSGEGRIALHRVAPDGDSVTVGNRLLTGFGRVARLARAPYYAGVFRERPLGELPASDVNGDGDNADVFPVLVARATDGWFVITDTNGDGSLGDEAPVRDYALYRETFSYGPLAIAVNLAEHDAAPVLDFFFDNSGHGTHVAGIAAGHGLFGVEGFDGVAPGAQVLALKISNNARGGISVTGSMVRAMAWAATFAARRGLPLVLNLSFGVGNEGASEGTAVIDSIVDAFALAHPDIVFVISAGNDGPGVSTVGFPGSAQYALTACALFPGAFAQPPQPGRRPADDILGWWSGRGGETQKPDLCAPGVAFSNVPPWQTGQEVSGGTSMAAPQLAGAVALLRSALAGSGVRARAVDLKRALMATAEPVPGATAIDAGTGVPRVSAALRWLRAGHQTGRYAIAALPDGGNTSRATAAYRRRGLASAGDTLQRFVVAPVHGQPHTGVLLRSDAAWLAAPEALAFSGTPETVTVRYDARALATPGLYVGTVWGRPATDTLGGAAFGLTNTVIVPYGLDVPVADHRRIRSGEQRRYFLDLPADVGGLEVEIAVDDPGESATVYLFEPTGQPQRAQSSAEVGGDGPRRATLHVRAEDLVPGVYEAVVVAPPLSGVTYTFRARRAEVGIPVIHGDSAVIAGGTGRVAVQIELVGATRASEVTAPGDAIHTIPVTAPAWATAMVVDVQLPAALWPRFTDFGVSVFDTTGLLVAAGPLNYAFGRLEVPLDDLVSRNLDVELFPAWAAAEAEARWEADVRIAFLAPAPVILGADSIAGEGRVALGIAGPDAPRPPEGFDALVRVTARAPDGAPAIRLGAASLGHAPPDTAGAAR